MVPEPGREAVLAELHEAHPLIARMKGLSRMYVWWPVSERFDVVRNVSSTKLPASDPLHPWSWPTCPWAHLHLDYAGPVQGKMILILIDPHSIWIEAYCTSSATSSAVIEKL